MIWGFNGGRFDIRLRGWIGFKGELEVQLEVGVCVGFEGSMGVKSVSWRTVWVRFRWRGSGYLEPCGAVCA